MNQEQLDVMVAHIRKILPKPFDWCYIPTGVIRIMAVKGITDEYSVEIEKPFLISKYPITNLQYKQFMIDNGYLKKQYWLEPGWVLKEEESWDQPSQWQNPVVNFDNGPVVGVSLFEASAFTKWLSAKSNLNIDLPTEAQWQLAAQGGDGRMFPWGDLFSSNHANTSRNPTVDTTPVDQYEHAASPFGVVDMVGNASEWTRTSEKDGSNNLSDFLKLPSNDFGWLRILRGGSWASTEESCNTKYRFGLHPSWRSAKQGFRIILGLEK